MKKAYIRVRLITNSGSDKHMFLSLCPPQLLDQEGAKLASANKERCERKKKTPNFMKTQEGNTLHVIQ